MFLKRKMNDSTTSYSDKILQIKEKIGGADANYNWGWCGIFHISRFCV